MDGGGGGGGQQSAGPTTSTVNNVSVPPELMPYAQRVLGQGEALTDVNKNPFQQYAGQRTAGFTPMQEQSFQNVGNMQTAGQLGTGTNMATMGGIGSLNAGQQYNQMATNPGAVSQFMSPYMQNAVDWQKQQAVQDYARQLPGMQAAATRAGAFGGSRQAIVEAEGQRNLQNQLAGIQATGTQNAYGDAMRSMQFGTTAGLQGYNQANQAAGTLGQLGQTQYGQQMGINQAQQQVGAQQQALQQQNLSNQYQDFLNQQNYPYKQLGFMSDLVRGMPLTQQSSSVYQAPPSSATQTIGLLGGLGSLAYGMGGGRAAGGEIKGYAEGGIAKAEALYKKLPREQLSKVRTPTIVDLIAKQEAERLWQHGDAQQAMSNYRAQPTVVEQEGMEAGNPLNEMADGGIVAFAGKEGSEVEAEPWTIQRMNRSRAGDSIEDYFPSRASQIGGFAGDVVGNVIKSPVGIAQAGWEGVKGLANLGDRASAYLFAPNIPQQPGTQQAKPAPVYGPGGMDSTDGPVSRGIAQAPPQGPTAPAPAAPSKVTAASGLGQVTRTSAQSSGEVNPYIKRLEKELDATGPEQLSKEELNKRAKAERTAALADVGVTDEGGYKDKIAALKTEAMEARDARDRDRAFAVAAGFFGMAGGKSPYAAQNIAEGFGIGLKQFMAVEKDFKEMERLRRQEQNEARKAATAEADGNLNRAEKAYANQEALAARFDAKKMETLGKLTSSWEATEQRKQASKDAAAARGVAASGVQAQREAMALQREDQIKQRREQMLLTALANEKTHLLKANPMAAMDPNAADAIHNAAMRNVLRLYPDAGSVLGMGGTAPTGGSGRKTVSFGSLPGG